MERAEISFEKCDQTLGVQQGMDMACVLSEEVKPFLIEDHLPNNTYADQGAKHICQSQEFYVSDCMEFWVFSVGGVGWVVFYWIRGRKGWTAQWWRSTTVVVVSVGDREEGEKGKKKGKKVIT